MLQLCLFLASFAAFLVSSDQQQLFKLRDKWVAFIDQLEQKQYDKRWQGNHTWRLVTPYPDSKIKVYCLDFRLSPAGDLESSCSHARVIVDDGVSKKRFCESQHNFHIIGESSKMTIDLLTSEVGGGFLECYAKSVQQPRDYETIDLLSGTGIRGISFPYVKGLDSDKAWKIRTTSDRKISLQCQKRLEGPLDSGVCAKDILTIDAGDGPKVSCDHGPVTMVSKGTEMTVRVETFKGTDSNVDCVVQSISGPNLNEADNIKYVEEDSSEQGVSPGTKRTTCPCGGANRDSGSRIINGTEVNGVSKYPFMVSMQYPGGGHFCGGSIISPIHILTAAHCVSQRALKNRPNPEELSPRVGIHNIYEQAAHGESQKLTVKEVHVPEEWFAVKGSLAADIAILVLETPIKFSKWVGPVCLTPTQPPIINKFIKAMGWGQIENRGYTDVLREAPVQVLDPLLCNKDPREICFKNGVTSTCYGDSGGPYVYVDPETNRYTQVGLVSYGFGQDCSGRFFIGTNTIHWFGWIQKIISATSRGYGVCQKE
uniref:Trypsin n=1 Tax=Lygus lineolaris TaxID=50650 RepID=A0A184WFX9_LYGLI|nr:trypsin precursor [Lygus lineolaris]